MTHDPIFLAGSDRSGVGLLGDILDGHPDVAISRRINFWTFYAGRYGSLEVTENLDRCLEDMWRFRRVTDLGIDLDDVKRRFLDRGDISYGGLFSAIGDCHAMARGKAAWGEKSLNSERHADVIFDSFPEARMVHVLRDPRDRHVSVMSHRGGKRAGVLGTTAVSVDSERRAARNARRYGSRYMVLRYEDLVSSPETHLTAVCDLIGVPYLPSLIAGGSPDGDGIVMHAGSVGRYAEDATPFHVAMIERLSRNGMRRRGYPLDRPELSTPQRLWLALGAIPVGWVFLRVWRPWSWLKSRFSRGPSQRRLAPEAA
jgi:hypothetical protein